MVSLNQIRPSIQSIITALCSSINVEAAVFDDKCHLLVSTKEYVEQKGNAVHTPPLEEVLSNGNALVSKPGFMTSCYGCRFKDHCPSTIEILNSIQINGQSIGVISITSFTKEGEERLNKDLNTYMDILAETSNLIGTFAMQQSQYNQINYSDKTLQSIIDLSTDSFFTINNQGVVTHCNPSALKLFPQCSKDEKTLTHLLPYQTIMEILDGTLFLNKPVNSKSLSAKVSSIPIMQNNKFIGAVVQVDQNFNKILAKNVENKIYTSYLQNSIIGNSAEIKLLKTKVEKIANSTSTVLITGETGTGKELFAKAIHYNSNRSLYPFIPINCSCIPDNLLESELFGYDDGAFTGAKRGGKLDQFELANKGTIFLDEIGDMPIYMQSKLLRVLQDKEITRVGGISSIPIDVRIIAATNRDLEDMVQKDEFRMDLYYRLNVIPLNIPPLKYRKDDIEILAMHFLNKYNLELKRHIDNFSPDVMDMFKLYDWPGNVRELENIVEHAVNMESSSIITPDSLPENFLKNTYSCSLEIKTKVKDLEMNTIKEALDKHGYDGKGKDEAAKELGISTRTLYRKIKEMEGA